MTTRNGEHQGFTRIYTLGQFTIETDGQPVRFGPKPPRKPLELLKVLIALGGNSVSVDVLCESLWPDADGDKARSSFTSTLSRLRKLTGSKALDLQDGRLSLVSNQIWVDAGEYTALVNSVMDNLAADEGAKAEALLNQALALYRGPFLDGEFNPPELLSARERLHGLFLRSIEKVAEFNAHANQYDKAIEIYRKGLAVDDVSEDFYRNLMLCCQQSGRTSEGIAAYERCRELLQAKYGIDPSSETEAVYRSLLDANQERSEMKASPAGPSPQDLPEGAIEPDITPPRPDTAEPQGERRIATVGFFDLHGYTEMNERLDPEEVEKIMSRIKIESVRIVESHGGIVNQFVGDEVLALFGIPHAHEDDPIRAVRAALEIVEAVSLIGQQFEATVGVPLQIHGAINTGLIVTNRRDNRDGQFGVTGDTINTCAGLALLSKPGEILVSIETHRLIEPYFRTEALPQVDLKGKVQPIVPYRILGESMVTTRMEAAERRGFTAYIGRERELEILNFILTNAASGQGQFITVVGEAGIGKSRLMQEFRKDLDQDRIALLEGRCQSYGTDMPYLPFINALRHGLNLLPEDTPAQLHEKTVNNVLRIDKALEAYLPLYLHLLSIPSDVHSVPKWLNGPGLASAIKDALGAIFTLIAQSQPAVVVFEDWHWADEASNDMLNYLLGVMPSTSMMLVVLYRPDFEPGWGNRSNHMPLILQPMKSSHVRDMIHSALGAESVPEGLVAAINTRTGGNPFFIEEMCKALREEGTLTVKAGQAILEQSLEALSLPDTVQAVIQTRIDRLDPRAHETLGVASVIGREFTRNLLVRVSGDQDHLAATLESLKGQELIHQTRVVPKATYMFKHALTQEVVYETLLRQKRRELHGLVARAIEESYSERLAEQFESLAGHYEKGEVWDKAFTFHLNSAVKAKKNHLMKNALYHFDKAKNILENRDPVIPWKLEYDLYFQRKEALGEFARWPDAYEELAIARDIAEREGDLSLKHKAMFARANAAFWGQLFNESIEELAELEMLLKDDPGQMLGVAALQAFVLIHAEKFQESMAKEKEAAQLLEQAPDSIHVTTAIRYLGFFARWRGNHRQAIGMFERLMRIQQDKVGIDLAATTLVHFCMALVDHGQYGRAIGLMEDMLEKTSKSGSLYSMLRLYNTIGWAHAEILNMDQAIEYNSKALVSVDELRGPRHDVLLEIDSFARLNLADISLVQGKFNQAGDLLENVYENAGKTAYSLARPRWKPRCLIALGELSLHRGELGRCEQFLSELDAHGLTEGFPFKKHQVRAGRLKGALLMTRNQPEEAEAELKKALGRAKEVEMPAEIWKTHQALGDFYTAHNQAEISLNHYRNALEIIQEIAENLTGPEMKQTFLASKTAAKLFDLAQGS